jgi:hypothetical protein
VVADVGDPAITLPFDLRLIRTAPLEIVVADELHVASVLTFPASISSLSLRCQRNAENDRQRRKR